MRSITRSESGAQDVRSETPEDVAASRVSHVASRRFAIAGAGLLGRLLAWRLLREGHAVTLLDRDGPGGERAAGRVAAAMLAPYSEAVHSERAVFDAGVEALAIWPRWLQQLQGDDPQARRVDWQQRGSVVVAHRNDAGNLEHFERSLRSRLPDRADRIQTLNGACLAELEPELAPTFAGGLYLPEEGCLDNWALLDSLEGAIRALGGDWHTEVEVESVQPGAVLCADGRRIEADVAVDTRGFGARPDWRGLRGVRGEVLWVHAPEVRISRPVRLMHPRYQLYIAPKPGQIYVIGATEIESESLAPMTVRSGLELQSALYSVHTGFAEASVLRAFANLRPAFADHLPRVRLEPGRWSLNGLYRHGYLLSPVLVSAALASARSGEPHPWVEAVAAMPAEAVSV